MVIIIYNNTIVDQVKIELNCIYLQNTNNYERRTLVI